MRYAPFLGCPIGMIRLRMCHGHKPVVRAIEVSIGVFIPDTIYTIGNERKTRNGGKLGIRVHVDMRHGGATLSMSEEI